MRTIALTPSGPQVPQMGIGTWAWGDRLFGTMAATTVRRKCATPSKPRSRGRAVFDTAELYGLGESETLLGRFERESGQSVQIATKYLPLPWRWSAEAVEEALSASLQRLGRERVELYQVHSPFNFLMGADTLMGALAREVKRGRIAAVGVSNYGAAQMEEAHGLLAAQGVPLAVNQVRYSLLTREIEANGVLDTARRLGVKILAYSPLAQGLLTGKYTAASPPEEPGASITATARAAWRPSPRCWRCCATWANSTSAPRPRSPSTGWWPRKVSYRFRGPKPPPRRSKIWVPSVGALLLKKSTA